MAFVLLTLLALGGVSGLVEDYCTVDKFASNSSWLQFTKEVSTTEYAVKDKFKSLHCCAKGYRTIEWYKDSRAYPWAGGVSSFILNAESANQTVYTTLAADSDGGNYTCLLKNDTHILVHTIHLAAVQKPPSIPRSTFAPTDQWVELGHQARFYCEAFVGSINLPDARSDITWKRVYPEGVKPRHPHLSQERIKKVFREDGQIVGAYFIINEVRSDDYGQYMCTVDNGDSLIEMNMWLHHKVSEIGVIDNSVPWRTLLVVLVSLVLLIVTIVTIYIKFWGTFIVTCKDAGVIGTKNEDKTYDVVVLHTEVEAQLVAAFIPILKEKYQYKCTSHQISDNWYSITPDVTNSCRSIVAVISPALLTQLKLKELIAKILTPNTGSAPIVVCLKELPKVELAAKDENGETLSSLLKKTKLLVCQDCYDKNFWLQLRLLLPARSNTQPIRSIIAGNLKSTQTLNTDAKNLNSNQPKKTEQTNDLDAIAMV